MKPNKNNSSIMQALLDLKASGGDANSIAILTQQLENNNTILEDADRLFDKHQHPEYVLTWCKLYGNVEFSRFLSVNALAVLIAMCQNMNHWNSLQISYRDIVNITALNSLKSVKPALQELIEKGCIAVQVPGTTKRPTVYMVNPEIATVGSGIPKLKDIFWELAEDNSSTDDEKTADANKEGKVNTDNKESSDTNNEDDSKSDDEESGIQGRWRTITGKRTYAKGTDFLEIGTRRYSFNRIKEPRLAKHEVKKDGNAPSDDYDEEIPFK